MKWLAGFTRTQARELDEERGKVEICKPARCKQVEFLLNEKKEKEKDHRWGRLSSLRPEIPEGCRGWRGTGERKQSGLCALSSYDAGQLRKTTMCSASTRDQVP